MVLLLEALFRRPLETHQTLQLLLRSGLDVCGLRLLYPGHHLLLSSSGELCSSCTAPILLGKAQTCKCTQLKSDESHICVRVVLSTCIFPKRNYRTALAVSFFLFLVLNIHELNF